MKNSQLYPFERNRYYAGKMLTSADFRAEQDYFNNKRRFLNRLLYGSGIICGCSVFNLDDLSFLVESGVVIDGLGREIVVETSVVKKLSAVEGFDRLETDRARLCIRYQEQEVHTVYALGNRETEQEYEYNRIQEGYQLFLMDAAEKASGLDVESEFLVKEALLVQEDFLVEFIMPMAVCRNRPVKACARVTKLTGEDKKLSYQGIIQTPAFLTADGGHELTIAFQDILLPEGGSVEKEYWMTVREMERTETSLVLKSGSHKASVDGVEAETVSGVSIRVMISDHSPRKLVEKELGKISLEMKNLGSASDYIELAELRLVRTDSAYLIEEVIEDGIKKYITAPSMEEERSALLSYFEKEAELPVPGSLSAVMPGTVSASQTPDFVPEVATGVLEIPLGEDARKGEVFYSGEILHGLGKGNVYVEIGYEHIAEDISLGGSAKSTVYGNTELFREDGEETADADTAVKVLNDKGSFIVAVRLNRHADFLVLSYRWVAIRFPSGNDVGLLQDYRGKSIAAETPTVVLGVKESYFFHVKYNNMEPCSVVYELTEPGSGDITSEGIYTAPAKEGVYEVLIYCADMPVICTYAYAIVKKKGSEESGQQT